jgi:NDP-sugar pyrophosphorylase family protein
MQEALSELKAKICSLKPIPKIDDQTWNSFASNCTVALMAGGESSRFKPVVGDLAVHKNAFKLPNGDTMIEMAIRMYKEAGINKFVALVYHESDSLVDLLGDGSALGVSIKYSFDPEKPVGKGGAVRNAFDNGSIDKSNYVIVHNPDDVIIDYDGSFPRDICATFIEGEKQGMLAEVVVVEETPAAYTGMGISDSVVQNIEMYPVIPIPAHVGVTILSPKVYPLFTELFDYEKKSDFEKVLFPILAGKKQLYAMSIPANCWVAVNNPKSYNELLSRLHLK